MGDTEDLYQIALLIDQLKHDDLQLRINASNSLCRIAAALGPERTRDELVPFLNDTTDDEDEVLLVVAEKLGDLRLCVGGSEHVHCLLEPLQLLAMVEENSVRAATIKSLELVASAMNDEQVAKSYVPFVLEMANKDWFTARISAAALFAGIYPRVAESSRRHFRSTFLKLCMDESPSVRRSALLHMGTVAQRVSKQDVGAEFLGVFSALANDQQDSVRIQVVPNCISLARIVAREQQLGQILPVVLSLSADKSWRVRWTLASQLPDVCLAMGEQISNDNLAVAFEALLNDAEAEVRSAAAANISQVCRCMSKDRVISKVLPITQRLVTDSSEHVRAALAGVINELALLLGREDTVTHLLPMMLLLLRDEMSDVRLAVISNLGTINRVIGIELLSQSLLPAIVDLSEDSKWRVRLAIIGHIPMLAEQLGKSFFSDRLSNLCMVWMGDSVYTVRRAAAANLQQLLNIFGERWSIDQLVPRIDRLHVHTNYLHRITALYAMQALIKALPAERLETHIVPLTTVLAKDAVPNVRFTAAKTLSELHGAMGTGAATEKPRGAIAALLRSMMTDSDRDVRFFSRQAVEGIERA